MKTPSSAIKLLTISVFTTLIVCFIFYRVGAFEAFFDPNTSTELTAIEAEFNSAHVAIDTPVVAKDSVLMEREIMPSSKMMIMPKPKKTDTIKKTNVTNAPPDQSEKKTLKKSNVMGSSKSGFIYEPEPKIDTTKNPKK